MAIKGLSRGLNEADQFDLVGANLDARLLPEERNGTTDLDVTQHLALCVDELAEKKRESRLSIKRVRKNRAFLQGNGKDGQ